MPRGGRVRAWSPITATCGAGKGVHNSPFLHPDFVGAASGRGYAGRRIKPVRDFLGRFAATGEDFYAIALADDVRATSTVACV